MWEASLEPIASGVQVHLHEDGVALTFRRFFELLEQDAEFVRWYSTELSSSPYEAFFWELPPLTTETFDRVAECVLIGSTALASLPADMTPFSAQFDRQPDASVITFRNLGGDALLVVPAPLAEAEAYPHLAAFLRRAPRDQVGALWQTTAACMLENLSASPTWLSTAGLGVCWLHLRLDTRPKYYRYMPYKSDPSR